MNEPRILITGADSFVGKNYITYSDHSRVDEVSLVENHPENIDFGKYDVVLHLVAIVHQLKQLNEDEYFRVNRDLCLRTAQAAKKAGVGQFIFLSTVKVYGDYNPSSGPWDEESECNPEDAYGKSKYEAEQLLLRLTDENFIVSIIRTPLVYGEGVKANMLNIMKLVDKLYILPFGGINNKRHFTYTRNLNGFIDRIIEKRASGIFIAMDACPLSTTDLVLKIAESLKKRRLLIKIPGIIIKIGQIVVPKIFERLFGSFILDNSSTLKRLDFTPQFSLEEGIKDMVSFYLKQKNSKEK